MWINSGAVCKGINHIKKRTPCQDAICCTTRDNICVIAVSDGLSSCEFSHIGAKTAVRFVCQYLSENFYESYKCDEKMLAQKICSGCASLLNSVIGDERTDKYLATLVAVAVSDNHFIVVHIGDGAAIAYSDTNSGYVISSPPIKSFNNSGTFSLYMCNSENNMRIIRGTLEDIRGFIVTSDGLKRCLYYNSSVVGRDVYTLFRSLSNESAKIPSNLLKKVITRKYGLNNYVSNSMAESIIKAVSLKRFICKTQRKEPTLDDDYGIAILYRRVSGIPPVFGWRCTCGNYNSQLQIYCAKCGNDLAKQYSLTAQVDKIRIMTGIEQIARNNIKYTEVHENGWFCTCGDYNRDMDILCGKCGRSFDSIYGKLPFERKHLIANAIQNAIINANPSPEVFKHGQQFFFVDNYEGFNIEPENHLMKL